MVAMTWSVDISVIVAAAAGMILGFLWYGPVFGNYWIKLMKFTAKDMEAAKKKGMTAQYFATFIGSIIMAFALDMLFQALGVTSIGGAWAFAVIVWVGFFLTLTLSSVLWEGKPLQLYILNNLYNLANLLIVSAILAAW